MTIAVSFPCDAPRAGAAGHFHLALTASVLAHLLFAATLVPEASRRSPQAAGAAPIAARLEPPLQARSPDRATADREYPLEPPAADRQATTPVRERKATLRNQVPALPSPRDAPLALPQIPDSTVYTARDLDSYPRPAVPFDTGGLEDRAAGQSTVVRFELLIDERGIVNDVALAGPEPAGLVEAELRIVLAATRFIPASKDGRAVKSRVLLSVDFGREKREP